MEAAENYQYDWVNKLVHWQWENHSLQIVAQTAQSKEVQIVFEPWTKNIWRYRFLPSSRRINSIPITVTPSSVTQLSWQCKDHSNRIVVSSSRLNLEIQKEPWQFTFRDNRQSEICGENAADIDGLGNYINLPLGYYSDGGEILSCFHSFHLRPDERLYGLGEKFTPLNKVGQRIVGWNVDALGSTSERSHKNIPFLLSNKRYGIFVNSSARIIWELGTISTQSFTFSVSSDHLEVFVIFGSNLAEILKNFMDLTGKPALPPKWSFGLWLSSSGCYRNQSSIKKLIDDAERNKLPLDVIHVDTWWMRWRKYCDFVWDQQAFPDHQNLITDIHSRKCRLSVWIQPYISIESDIFPLGKSRDYFVKKTDGSVYVIDYGLSLAPRPDGVVRKAGAQEGWNAPVAIVDFTNPAAVKWFQDLMRPILRQGVDVFKTDFGEDIPEDAVFYEGQTGKVMHNLYPYLYNKTVFEVIRQEKGYGLVWSRSGFAGSQHFPVCWSGDPAADWDSLAATIRGGLSIGISGIPFWSHDIGGYRGIPTPELYIRWAQFGLFSSHSRLHGDSPREPWFFGEKILDIFKKFAHLRYQLFPYIYSTAQEAIENGLPVIRAMPLAFPDDPHAADIDLQYMFGPFLLVAPVYQPDHFCSVYLPPGHWLDFFNNKEYQGPVTLTLKVPLSKMPLFLRQGAILPMMTKTNRIPDQQIDPLLLLIFPGNSSYIYREDKSKTKFLMQMNRNEMTFLIDSPLHRFYVLKFLKINQFRHLDLFINGRRIKRGNQQVKLFKNYLQLKILGIKKVTIKIRWKKSRINLTKLRYSI